MKPILFKCANRELLPPIERKHSANVVEISPLPVWTDNEQCVSCWQMTLRERLSALLFGRVWLAVLSGKTQPPVCVMASRGYFRERE